MDQHWQSNCAPSSNTINNSASIATSSSASLPTTINPSGGAAANSAALSAMIAGNAAAAGNPLAALLLQQQQQVAAMNAGLINNNVPNANMLLAAHQLGLGNFGSLAGLAAVGQLQALDLASCGLTNVVTL